MNHHEPNMGNGVHSSFIAPELLESLVIRRFPVMPFHATDNESELAVRISVVGIGLFGAEISRELAGSLAGVVCHEVLFDPAEHDEADLADLFAMARESDLLFIVSDFNDRYCEQFFDQLAKIAKTAGALTVGVVPDGDVQQACSPEYLAERARFVDTIFRISLNGQKDLVTDNVDEPSGLVNQLIRNTITVISDIITQTSLIGIDFADINAILKSRKVTGKFARMGLGVENDATRGETAALLALDCLYAQQVKTTDVGGIIACLHGSSLMTLDDYEAASRIIHKTFHEDANMVIGFLFDESMGDNVRVTIMTAEKA